MCWLFVTPLVRQFFSELAGASTQPLPDGQSRAVWGGAEDRGVRRQITRSLVGERGSLRVRSDPPRCGHSGRHTATPWTSVLPRAMSRSPASCRCVAV